MRTLTSGMLAEVAKTMTDPVFLIKIDFGSQFIYATTRESIAYGGDTYNTLGAKMLTIDGTRVRFSLPNHDRVISNLAFAGQVQGNTVEVFLHYNGETIGRFNGLINSPSITKDYNVVNISCVSEYSLYMKWPSVRLRPPDANHLPPAGTNVYIGPWKITLERDIG